MPSSSSYVAACGCVLLHAVFPMVAEVTVAVGVAVAERLQTVKHWRYQSTVPVQCTSTVTAVLSFSGSLRLLEELWNAVMPGQCCRCSSDCVPPAVSG